MNSILKAAKESTAHINANRPAHSIKRNGAGKFDLFIHGLRSSQHESWSAAADYAESNHGVSRIDIPL
jgi:hypothetical protein